MDPLSVSVLRIIPYAIASNIRGSSASRSPGRTKPEPEREPGYMQTYFGPPCQEPDLAHLSKDTPPNATYALPPPTVNTSDFVEAGKTLVKKLAEHLTLERLHAIVIEFNKMVDQDLEVNVLLARLSTLLADKPTLLRSLKLLTLGNDLLVTVHPHRTYLTIFPDRPHACSWALDPTKVRIPPTPPIPTITLPQLASASRPIQRATRPRTSLAPVPPAPPPASPTPGGPPSRYVVIADPAKRMSLSRAFCAALNTRLAHKPSLRAELFRLFAAAGPFGASANAQDVKFPAGSEAFVGLAFGALDCAADVRRAGALLLDAPDLLRGLADFVDGEEARAELAGVVELADLRAARLLATKSQPGAQ